MQRRTQNLLLILAAVLLAIGVLAQLYMEPTEEEASQQAQQQTKQRQGP